jgi:hypothetical protein
VHIPYFYRIDSQFGYYGGRNSASQTNGFYAKILKGHTTLNDEFYFSIESTAFTDITTSEADVNPLSATVITVSSDIHVLTYNNACPYSEKSPITFDSDIVFPSGAIDVMYIQELLVDTLDYNYACSITGETSFTAVLDAHPLASGALNWVTLNSDLTTITVNPPEYDPLADNIYYLAMNLTTSSSSEAVSRRTTIRLYKCMVENWKRCNNDTVSLWEEWKEGYSVNKSK